MCTEKCFTQIAELLNYLLEKVESLESVFLESRQLYSFKTDDRLLYGVPVVGPFDRSLNMIDLGLKLNCKSEHLSFEDFSSFDISSIDRALCLDYENEKIKFLEFEIEKVDE